MTARFSDETRWLCPAIFLLALALLLRAPQFGNPVIQIDEQFYLLVGDRMWSGSLPFVDSWDRKPVGLFVLYAAIRLLGGDGIIQYQIVATCFAAATALIVAILASRIAPRPAAITAGIVYLVYLLANGGDGGQAPVFYNLPVAAAALAVVRTMERPAFDRTAFLLGCGAMLLMGLALQIKYSVLFEGVFLGLALLVAARRNGTTWTYLALAAAIWVALALLPTAIAWVGYAALGHAEAFFFANFESIFLRSPYESPDIGRQIRKIASRMLPIAAAAIVGGWLMWRRAHREEDRSIAAFLTGWALVALGALVGFGTYHDHYALPLILPFAVVGAPALAWMWKMPSSRIPIPVFATVVIVAGLVAAWLVISDSRWRRGGGEIREMAALVARSPDKSLFVFSGDPILYHLAQSPLPTRWHFPTLLSEQRDSRSLGTDMHHELARVMAARPHFIVTRSGYPFAEADRAAWESVEQVLASDYAVLMSQPIGRHRRLLYQRRSGHTKGLISSPSNLY